MSMLRLIKLQYCDCYEFEGSCLSKGTYVTAFCHNNFHLSFIDFVACGRTNMWSQINRCRAVLGGIKLSKPQVSIWKQRSFIIHSFRCMPMY